MPSTPRKKSISASATGPAQHATSSSSAEVHARKIADASTTAWHGAYGSGRLDVPVSVVATLAALPHQDSQGNDTATAAMHWDAGEFVAFARHTWSSIIRQRPEATHLLYPIISWIFDDSETTVHSHAHAVAQAALRAGQPALTGTDRRFDTDLLGVLLTALRPKSSAKARGQFYTPPDIAELLALMSDIDEHSNVIDPMMGTGGQFRAAAAAMRERGRDPRTTRWVGCDIDEIAVACATVNSMIWGLGREIVFYAGNTLTDDWETTALAQRAELLKLANGIKHDQKLIALLRSL